MGTPVKDVRWLRHAFLRPINDRQTNPGITNRRRYSTSAVYKFTNSSLGGNWAFNSPPQFTRYADIRSPGKGRKEDEWVRGMGRYYSEAIDDTQQLVHMSFGVPEYSSWTSFFTNFYDRNAALLANTGRSSGAFYNLGLAGGYIVSLPLQPFILGATAVARVMSFLQKSKPSKWYYFKPTMHSYWSAVNTMANELAINMGLIPRVFGEDRAGLRDGEISDAEIARMHQMFPELWREDGGIDVMALARRTQMMSDKAQEAAMKIKKTQTSLEDLANSIVDYSHKAEDPGQPTYASSKDMFEAFVKTNRGADTGGYFSETFSEWSELTDMYDFVRASQRDGSQFASFRVQYNGAVSESFSNSTRESDVGQTLNTKVQTGRNVSFNMMGGSITGGVGEVIDAIQSTVAGALDSVNLGGLATLTGTAFVDIPKYWDGSTANLPRAEYTIPLPNPYGNPISRYTNLIIPICMILAAGLPLSAGRSSYTSPFLCQIYHQGRVQIQLGMIDSITITRGTGNVGWSAEHNMLGAEMTISVVDMSSIMHVPVKAGFASGDWLGTSIRAAAAQSLESTIGNNAAALGLAVTDSSVWDEQSTFSDYMSVLSSLSLENNYYVGRRLNLNMTRALRRFKSWKTPSNFASYLLDGQPARTLSGLSQYSTRFE